MEIASDSTPPPELLSKRGHVMLAPATSYLGKHFQALSDEWCPKSNPQGFVSLAVAENKLTFDVLRERLLDLKDLPLSIAQYENMTGMTPFREALASFLADYILKCGPVDPNHIVVNVGLGSIINHMSMALFDKGDGILIPAPSYASFDFDLKVLAGQIAVSVPLQGPDYRLTREALEASYHHATTQQGLNIRGVILTNPHNPLGIVYSEQELRVVLEWSREKGIHLISDEIYALSVFSTNGTASAPPSSSTRHRFISMAEVCQGDLGGDVHILWGFSKDFGVSGFRCGVLLTHNPYLLKALDSISYFAAVPNPIQMALTDIITDRPFLDHYILANQHRLLSAYQLCCTTLDRLHIPYVPACAGMFIWVDLSSLLKDTTSWDAEDDLFDSMTSEVKLVLTPGKSNHADKPGLFRICYAFYHSTDKLAEGMRRLEKFILAHARPR